jgi:ABC-type Fe3+/spermidine/putrescine transport system ATPase subunit
MREEIRRIHRETKLTTIYVTHDQQEALALADQIGLMNAGRLEQVGAPLELYRSPQTPFVTQFLGVANFLTGTVIAVMDAGHVKVQTAAGELVCAMEGGAELVGQTVSCLIRPHDVIALRGGG